MSEYYDNLMRFKSLGIWNYLLFTVYSRDFKVGNGLISVALMCVAAR